MENKKRWNSDFKVFLVKTRVIPLIIIIGILLIINGCALDTDLKQMSKEALRGELENVPNSPRKVDILNELAYRESRTGDDIAFKYATQALNLANELKYSKGIVDSYCSLGLLHFFRCQYEGSKEKYELGLKMVKDIKYPLGEAKISNGIARYHQLRGEYDTALRHFIKSKEICEDIREKRELAAANYGFGALYYYDQKDYKKGLAHFKNTLSLGQEIGDKNIITSGYYAIGVMYHNLEQDDKAMENFGKCSIVSEKNKIKYNEANANEGIGDIYVKKGKGEMSSDNIDKVVNFYEKAEKKYKISEQIFIEIKDCFQIAEIKKRLGKLYHQWGDIKNKEQNYRKALDYLHEALRIAKKKNIRKTIEEVAEELFQISIKMDDSKNALMYYYMFKKKNEFLKEKEMLRSKMAYDFEKRTEKERLIRILWIAAFGLAAIVLIAVLFIAMKLAKQKKELSEQKQELSRQKQELEKSYNVIERMSKIGQLMTSITLNLSEEEIYGMIYSHIKELMDVNVFWIYWHDEELNRLVLVGGKEEDVNDISHFYELKEKNRPAVKCFLEQRTLVFRNYPKEYPGVFGVGPPKPKKGETFKSHIFHPLVIKGTGDQKDRRVGVITVQSPNTNAYSDYHVNIFKSIGGYAAIALDNANVYNQIADQKTKVEGALEKEKEINDHKDILMHTVSHQYKTPISIIRSSAQILRDYLPELSKEEIDDQLIKIFSNIKRMLNLINDLLLYSKRFNPDFYDLLDICKKFVEEVKNNEGKNHDIVFKVYGECGRVKLDKDLIKIILHNLIVNSINYSSGGSKIIIDLKCEAKQAVIRIQDNGIGIPEDYFKREFERFHRGNNVGHVPGTGLGLSIVKRYIDLHDGKIKIESQLNIGTTVTVTIPRG